MSLQQQIDQAIKESMISKNADKLSTLRFLKSALKYSAIEKKVDGLNDAECRQVIQKQIKQRRESIQQFRAGGRVDLAEKEEREAAILEAFLPKQISDDELNKIVGEAVKEAGGTSKKDFGRLMKLLTEKLAGQAEGQRISAILGKILV